MLSGACHDEALAKAGAFFCSSLGDPGGIFFGGQRKGNSGRLKDALYELFQISYSTLLSRWSLIVIYNYNTGLIRFLKYLFKF